MLHRGGGGGGGGGEETEYITDRAIHIIKSSHSSPNEPIFIYFITGLPGLTTKKKKNFRITYRRHQYQEIIINESATEIHRRVEKIFRESAARILKQNAIPIFATITPRSIQTWNKHRLQVHRTSHLNYFHQYQKMQDTIEAATLEINKTIHNINSTNKVHTLKLAQDIIYHRHGHLRTHGKLPDGVHPNKNIITSWTKKMKEIINRNIQAHPQTPTLPPPPSQNTHPTSIYMYPQPQIHESESESDSEQDSPKRSWRHY